MKLSSLLAWMTRRTEPGGLDSIGRGFLALSLVVFVLGIWTSCDTGSRNSSDDGVFVPGFPTPGGGGGGGRFELPILFGIDNIGDDDTICVGQVVTLRGLNFSPDLNQNVVIFQAGAKEIRTVPIAVAFPADTNPLDGRDSLLRVVVPTGASTGSIQLFVNGNFANQQGIIVCPLILGFEVGINRLSEMLVNTPPVGFDPQFGPDTVWIHGLNFEEVTDVVVEDSDGRRFVVGPQVFRRPRLDPDNGLDSIRFPLTNAKLAIKEPRDNLRIWVIANDILSNEVAVPVQTLNAAGTPVGTGAPLGATVNGVILPWGVRTGPVRIHYSLYDRPVSMSYRMEFEWTVNNGLDWFPATAKLDDPIADGVQPDLPGVVLPGSLHEPSRYQLIRGGGGFRTFTWDPANDLNFRALNESADANGNPAPRNWSVSFRISANPSFIDGTGTRFSSGVLFVTPPIAYFDLEDRPGDVASDLRRGSFTEDFGDNLGREDRITDALWGPPFNRGTLEGQLESRGASQFGTGEFDLEMDFFPPEERPDEYQGEFYEIDTTRMRISHVMLVQDPDPLVGVVQEATIVFPNAGIVNPGEEAGEFHMRAWTIAEGMAVQTRGANPLVVRLSGPDPRVSRTAFFNGGTIDANGFDGTAPSFCLGLRGIGGPTILGSGEGGGGATIITALNVISQIQSAGDGGLTGGGGGLTTTAIDPDVSNPNNVSRYNGSPGGGGGNIQAGAPGDGGRPQPTTFPNPRGGHGGPKRGSPMLNPLSPGSGGGGGGASLVGVVGNPGLFAPVWGGGGGSGGGAIEVVANGDIVFGAEGQILANGGNGGDADVGVIPPMPTCPTDRAGPGGGGSGGCVLLRASGAVVVDCHQIEVRGGQPGNATSTINSIPGSGVGADGWIRIESRGGGVPFCNTLPIVETALTSLLRRNASARTINVQDTSGFPSSGKLRIDDELVSYSGTTANSFTDVVRAIDGTELAEHPEGSIAQLLAVLAPPEAMVEGGIATAPNEDIETGLGLDQTLHCTFIPSRDQVTGEILTDERGNPRSIWVFDTDSGTVFDPRGFIVKTALDSSRPNVLQLTRLLVDEDVTLKGEGDLPMVLLVRQDVDISGTLDVSGENGGLVRFDPGNLDRPAPGLGGEGGPGGGDGGIGGTIVFIPPVVDDDEGNVIDEIRRDPTRVEVVPGQAGFVPGEIEEHFHVIPDLIGNERSFDVLQANEVARPTGGLGIRDASCEGLPTGNQCEATAGGGGGGGNLTGGGDGQSQNGAPTHGLAGSKLGTDDFRINGGLLRFGGGGGAGGGPSIALSRDYITGNAGRATFQSRARYVPGTGGGGGGGILHVAVRGAFFLRSSGRVLANGGSAFQSMDLGGNGGGGAAGSIFIQVRNNFTVEPGAVIEARGGKANLALSRGGGVPLYEGNIRPDGRVFGGLGGDGSPGRVRIEAPRSSLLGQGSGTVNSSLFTGFTSLNAEGSVAYSKPISLGVGPGGAVLSHDIEVTQVTVRGSEFGQPGETAAIPLWWIGGQSRNEHGRVDETKFHTRPDDIIDRSQGIASLSGRRLAEFLRFEVRMVSDNITREVPAVQRIILEYQLRD